MIYDFFTVTGRGESIPDFFGLVGINHTSGDHVQGSETKRDEVHQSVKKIPEDGILEHFFKMRLRDSEPLKSTLTLFSQDTAQNVEEPSCLRLKDMVRGFPELKMKDMNFGAKKDHKTFQGAAAKRKGDGKRRSRGRKTRRLLSMAL